MSQDVCNEQYQPIPLIQTLSIQIPSVPILLQQAPLIQAPMAKKVFLAQISPVQALSASAPSATNDLSYKHHEKHLKQV